MARELLFSVTKDDFRIDTFKVGGNGGQKVNKTNSGVRFTHNESGAVGSSTEYREQSKNRVEAFKRCVATKEFKNWHRIKASEMMLRKQGLDSIEQQVDKAMSDRNLRVEVLNEEEKKWVEIK